MKVKRFIKKHIKFLFLILLIIVVIICYTIFTRKKDTMIIEKHDLYQYDNTVKSVYKGKIRIDKESKKITKLSFEQYKVNLDSNPLYYSDLKKAIFPSNMLIAYPKLGTQYKINYFTQIYIEDGETYLEYANKKIKIVNTIIFDGNDLYFITERCNVIFGKNNISVNPLSYVLIDTYNNKVNIYDYKNDKVTIYDNKNKDEVIITNKDIKVNGTNDLMYYQDKSKLFIKDVSVLNNLKF